MTPAERGRLERRLKKARGWNRVLDHVYAAPLYRRLIEARPPARLRGVPPDPWPASAAAGRFVLDGEFALPGLRIGTGVDPWDGLPERPAAAAALHGFTWLPDLRAVASDAARACARALIDGWITRFSVVGPFTWSSPVLGERISNWLAAADFLAPGADAPFQRRFLASAATQARHLGRVAAAAPRDGRAFAALKGLVLAAAAIPGSEASLAPALRRLEQAIASQVLADGGHIERCPSTLLGVLRRLIDVRAVLLAARVEVPALVQTAIDRMAPVLRALRLGDGGLALFNGGQAGDRQVIDAALALAAFKGKPMAAAPHAGFQRLAAGRTVVVVDAGAPPPPGLDTRAHAAPLAFEMSVGKDRLVVSMGAPAGDDDPWSTPARATAAHSTLIAGDRNAAEILSAGGIGRRPGQVTCNRREADGATWLDLSHDGYASLFGLIHRRRLFLDAAGDDLRGEDSLERAGVAGSAPVSTFAVRFHLHPQVHASPTQGGQAILLRLPGGAGWRFRADGAQLTLEPSVYLGDGGPPRRTDQIVLSGPARSGLTVVKWAFRRERPRA